MGETMKKSADTNVVTVDKVYKELRESMRADPEVAAKAAEVMLQVDVMMKDPGEKMKIKYVVEASNTGSTYTNEFGVWTLGGGAVEIPSKRAKKMIADFPGCFIEAKEPKKEEPKASKSVRTASLSGPKGK